MDAKYKKAWYLRNRKRLLLKAKEYRLLNATAIQAYDRSRNKIRRADPLYVKKHQKLQSDWVDKNREKLNKKRRENYTHKPIIRKTKEELAVKSRIRNQRYYRLHKTKILETKTSRLNSNISLRLKKRLRYRLWSALKGKNKHKKTLDLIGCSTDELIIHLEKLFSPGMSWTNYGRGGWHIDHIRPFASFDLTNPKEIEQSCHYSNLQPLWERDNLSKGSKYEPSRK